MTKEVLHNTLKGRRKEVTVTRRNNGWKRKASAVENPKTEEWEPRNEYLSGNVRHKLQEARDAAQDDERFNRHASESEAVQPPRGISYTRS